MPQVSLPAVTDDDGTGQTGTAINKAWSDAVATELDVHVHSTSNPTIHPKTITDEVVAARGSEADLDTRLSVSLNADGTLITPATLVTLAQLQGQMGAVNLLANEDFLIWSAGATSDPAYWYSSGSPTIQMCGTGLVDTARKAGPYCIRLTYGAATGYLWQTVVGTDIWANMDFLEGQKVGLGCWVKSSIANHARIAIDDGAAADNSDYHTGGGSWEWLEVTRTISASATSLSVNLQVAQAGAAYFSGPTLVFSDFAPARWQPSRRQIGHIHFAFDGALAVADSQGAFIFMRPALLLDVQAGPGVPHDGTPVNPAAGPITIDVEKYETGAAWVSVFSGAKDIVADGTSYGSVQPDGDYDHRCFCGATGVVANLLNSGIRLNLDVVSAAEGFWFVLRYMEYVRALEGLYDYDHQGVAITG
jgi:hypothetical protein